MLVETKCFDFIFLLVDFVNRFKFILIVMHTDLHKLPLLLVFKPSPNVKFVALFRVKLKTLGQANFPQISKSILPKIKLVSVNNENKHGPIKLLRSFLGGTSDMQVMKWHIINIIFGVNHYKFEEELLTYLVYLVLIIIKIDHVELVFINGFTQYH
jgi:hypothetical protein